MQMGRCLRDGDKEWLFSPFGRMSAMRREHPGWSAMTGNGGVKAWAIQN